MDLLSARILSLCTGIGGLDIGVKRALPGSRCYVYCEREAYCVAVLVTRMQEGRLDQAPVWSDVTTFDGRPFRGHIDLVIGSYPCQGESLAGKGLGTADPRWLWPEFARIIREVGPEWCFFENVSGHLSRSFRHVRSDLQGMGYTVAAGLFQASEIGSPQKRERIFILAYAQCAERGQEVIGGGRFEQREHTKGQASNRPRFHGEPLADASGPRYEPGDGRLPGDAGRNGGWAAGISIEPERREPAMVHATGQPQREPADAGQPVAAGGRARDEPGDPGERDGPVADSGSLPRLGAGPGPQGRTEVSGAGDWLPEFPPGPGDLDAWRTVLAVRPDLAPAVGKPGRKLLRLAQRFLQARTEAERQTFKPRVRDLAHGLSGRVDKLRALGNAVVPAQAEYAFRELYAALTLPKEERPPQQSMMFDI